MFHVLTEAEATAKRGRCHSSNTDSHWPLTTLDPSKLILYQARDCDRAILPQWLNTLTAKMGGWLHWLERLAKVGSIRRRSSHQIEATGQAWAKPGEARRGLGEATLRTQNVLALFFFPPVWPMSQKARF